MKFTPLIAALAATTLLSACAQNGQTGSGVMNGGGINKSDVGTLAGAIGGGVIGHNIGGGAGQTVATIGGTLLGAYLGNQIGSSLDAADRAAYSSASQRAMENAQPGQSLPWQGQNASGTITPKNQYKNAQGEYCREYSQTIKVGGKTQQGYGTACRQPDGSWQIVE